MRLKTYINKLKAFILFSISISFFIPNSFIYGELANLTRNDPYPPFSSVYPFSYLTDLQINQIRRFDYSYPVRHFRLSVSPYRQYADFGRDENRNATNLGDIPRGRWNMLGLFWDPVLRDQLFEILDIKTTPTPNQPCDAFLNPNSPCFCEITDPKKSDPNKEFGFFTIPMIYRKTGLRFEGELLLIDRCFYAIGCKFQFGVANIRQTVLNFSDLTCQALGTACPVTATGTSPSTCPRIIKGSTTATIPLFADVTTTPSTTSCNASTPGGITTTNPDNPCCTNFGPVSSLDCVPVTTEFKPCCDATLCMGYSRECKDLVINNIMRQKNLITQYLGINTCDFNIVGLEDLRLSLFYRQIFVINQESAFYPRLLLTPFLEVGVGLPLFREQDFNKAFSLPIGNNNHLSTGATGGFNFSFLDTIDVNLQAGFTKFFEQEFCNYRLPTHEKESGIFPYKADVNIRPGTTWHGGIGLRAYQFLPNFSFWSEYLIVAHLDDNIKVCRSFIPTTSKYYKQGFLVDKAECISSWEVHMINAAFNYALSPNLSAGVLVQIPVRQRNAYRSGTLLGTITFRY